ncbi:MAG: BolA family protein [Woeseia sp.]
MTEIRCTLLRSRLSEKLNPTELLIKDQSLLHIGHQGAQDGKGHFDVTIVSSAFLGLSRIRRHQLVYDAVGDLLETDIHALRIKAFTPAER